MFAVTFACFVVSFPALYKVKVTKVYANKATFTITKVVDSDQPLSPQCTLNYQQTGTNEEKYVNLTNEKEQETVTLTGLQTGTNYTVTLQCSIIKSIVTFKTGMYILAYYRTYRNVKETVSSFIIFLLKCYHVNFCVTTVYEFRLQKLLVQICKSRKFSAQFQ
jgi:hypothetical protein